jgi:hypothetical protein
MQPHNYSFSKISDYMACPLKYKFRYIDFLLPKRKAMPLAMGSCMANGVAKFRSGGTSEESMQAFMDAWKEEGSVLPMDKATDPKRSVERGLEILSQYMIEYPDDPKETIMPEVRFEEEIMPNIIWRGRIDGVMKIDNTIAIVEDKTSSWWGEASFTNLQNSFQVLSYLAVARRKGLFEILGRQNPKILLNIIYIHEKNFRWPRRFVTKFNQEIDAAWVELLKWVEQVEKMRAIDFFPAADYSICSRYGGCEYLPLRFAPEDMKKDIIEANYVYGNENHYVNEPNVAEG